MRTGARLHRADIAPVVVITAGVALAAVPFAVALSPVALAAVWLASTAARSIAPVHQHCHAHKKVFRQRSLDAAYDVMLMLAAGNVTSVWELQHVQGHHRRYLARQGDPANNHRFGGGRLRFTILGDAMSVVDSLRLARGGRTRARLWRQQLAQLAVLVAAIVLAPVTALGFVVAPWLVLRWAVFWYSHAQHADVPMTDVYSGSVTRFGWTNRIYLNVGHHTAHHDQPTLHWTLLPARTEQIIERIPASCLR